MQYEETLHDVAAEPPWDIRTDDDLGPATVPDISTAFWSREADYHAASLNLNDTTDPWSAFNSRQNRAFWTSDHSQWDLSTFESRGSVILDSEQESLAHYGARTETSTKSQTQRMESCTKSQRNDAFSSTLPTSRGAEMYEPEDLGGKQLEDEIRDSDTVYSLESSADGERYVSVFAHRLLCDLRSSKVDHGFSDLSPDFVGRTLKQFARRLYEESKDPFQWATSVVLHRKRG